MADRMPPPMTLDRLHKIAYGQSVPGVLHACPDCPFGQPVTFCRTCFGIGTVDDHQIDQWQARVNDEARRAAGEH